MQIDGKRTLITNKGYTHDIMNEVSNTYVRYWKQCADIAKFLTRSNEYYTCKAIFWYISNKVKYLEDIGEQKIKTPARLLHDGNGDCKSYAIFIASCLRCLGIPAVFRYVSFGDNDIPTHVYIVTKSGIIIDPVERVNGKPVFNYASDFNNKIDIDIMQPTIISRLSGTENNEDINSIIESYQMYEGSEPFVFNTIAQNWINSEIDLHLTLLNSNVDNAEKIQILNYIDRLIVLKRLYYVAKDNNVLMAKMACVMQQMEDENKFVSHSLNDADRVDNLRALNSYAKKTFTSLKVADGRGRIFDWVKANVIDNNHNDLTDKQINSYNDFLKTKVAINGKISDADRRAIENKFKQSGLYFSYAFLSDNFVNNHKEYFAILRKRIMASRMINGFANDVRTFMNKKSLENILLSGAIQQANGNQPDKNIANFIEEKRKSKIGEPISLGVVGVISIITAIVGLLGTVLDLMTKIFGRKSVTPTQIQMAKIQEADFIAGNIGGQAGTDQQNSGVRNNLFGSNAQFPIMAIGAIFLGYLFFSKKNDKQ